MLRETYICKRELIKKGKFTSSITGIQSRHTFQVVDQILVVLLVVDRGHVDHVDASPVRVSVEFVLDAELEHVRIEMGRREDILLALLLLH